MMKRWFARVVALVSFCVPLVGTATITNPAPGTFGADDGSATYAPAVDTFFFEAFDATPALGVLSAFGFYRVADPSVRITVFDAADQGPPDQTAYANFVTGGVLDLDGGVVQNSFAPGAGAVGFFLDLDIGGSLLTVYSEAALNGGFDLMAAFPSLGVPGAYMIGVELPDGRGGFATVYFASVSGFTAARTVPEPSVAALLLLGVALATVAGSRRRG
jgi:hypothetical protein